MKKLSVIILAFLSTLLISNAFALGGNCGNAIFQIENKLNYNLTVSGVSGDVTGYAANTTVKNTSSHPTHIADLNSSCGGDTTECTMAIANISGSVGGSYCNIDDVNITFKNEGSACIIKTITFGGISSGCGKTGEVTDTGHHSYPTLIIGGSMR